ncbi:MAG: heme ABC transporter ATP-binding protein [Halioglobus sp.]
MSTLQLDKVDAAPWGNSLLQNINFTAYPGDVLALAGPNGAGKTSLLKLLAGDFSQTAGQLTFGDRPLLEWSALERARRLAFLPQMSLLNFPYTVEEVVMLGRIPHSSGQHTDAQIVEQALQLTDITSLRHRLYTHLSGGEKQRAQLARIFAQISGETSLEGRQLLLDEPTSALDMAHQQQVMLAVQELAGRGCAVVLALHDLNLAASVADLILVLNQGQQVALGTPDQILTSALFQQVFGVRVSISRHPLDDHPMITVLRETP